MLANKWLGRRCPQNFIIKKPWAGSLVLASLVAVFFIVYKPLGVHASYRLSFEATVIIYCIIVAIPVALAAILLKKISYFNNPREWTIKKELAAIALIVLLMGTIIYFAAFIIEEPSDRWNLKTLLDSYTRTILGAAIPLLLISLINYPYWFFPERLLTEETHSKPINNGSESDVNINISSMLKKEKLSFSLNEFVYAASEGNYVNFYLLQKGKIVKAVIRNSINNVEQQLAYYNRVMRVHRAFIVNVDMVRSMRGNSLGYTLKLNGLDQEIPVSRKNTSTFRTLFQG
jgi:hypothetical protein